MKVILPFLIALCMFSCNDTSAEEEKKNPEETSKPKYLWFDAEANRDRFIHQDSIRFYLDKAKNCGFTQIVVDVKPITGDVLYKKTSFMDNFHEQEKTPIEWDYLQYFIDEAKKRGLKVSVSATIFPAGRPSKKDGLVYRNTYWADRAVIEHTANGMINVMDDQAKVAAFLNPALPEVQEFALKFIREIVTNYDIDGFSLDYCRYLGVESDFSDRSKVLFEEYIGEKVSNFPNDIFSWSGTTRQDGRYAKRWFEFRSKVIHDFVKKAKEEIKSIKPNVTVEYWAASWYGALYLQAQNWASKKYDPQIEFPSWASANYKNTGFAEHLDIFMDGAYLETVSGIDNPESIEYAYIKGKRLLKDDCKMYGSIYALSNKNNIENAVYTTLTQTQGLVVFDIVQVIELDLWESIKKGIERSGY